MNSSEFIFRVRNSEGAQGNALLANHRLYTPSHWPNLRESRERTTKLEVCYSEGRNSQGVWTSMVFYRNEGRDQLVSAESSRNRGYTITKFEEGQLFYLVSCYPQILNLKILASLAQKWENPPYKDGPRIIISTNPKHLVPGICGSAILNMRRHVVGSVVAHIGTSESELGLAEPLI